MHTIPKLTATLPKGIGGVSVLHVPLFIFLPFLYAGQWVRPTIPNPEYVSDDSLYLYEDNSFIGLDLWQVKSGSIFDNIIITDSVAEAKEFYEVPKALSVWIIRFSFR